MYLGLAASMLAVWFILGYSRLQRAHFQYHEQAVNARAALADFSATLAQLPDFIDTRTSLDQARTALSSRLYSKQDILRLLSQLRQFAKESKITIHEISPPVEELLRVNASIPDRTSPLFIDINITLEGDFISFGRFVGKLEQQTFYRGVNFCRILGSPDLPEPPRHQFGFKALLGNTKGA